MVTRATSYRDNDKMLSLFTLENGIVSACLRGAKKPDSKFAFAGEPFCFCEYVLSEKDGRRTVKEATQIDGFYNLRFDVDSFAAASSVAEFVNAFMLDGMKSYELFLAVINSYKLMAEGSVNPRIVLICFYLKALGYVGYELNFDCCSRCGCEIGGRVFFDFDGGAVCCADCADAMDTEFRIPTYELLKACSEFDFQSADELKAIESSASENSIKGALKFLDFAFKQNAGVALKSHKSFISD